MTLTNYLVDVLKWGIWFCIVAIVIGLIWDRTR